MSQGSTVKHVHPCQRVQYSLVRKSRRIKILSLHTLLPPNVRWAPRRRWRPWAAAVVLAVTRGSNWSRMVVVEEARPTAVTGQTRAHEDEALSIGQTLYLRGRAGTVTEHVTAPTGVPAQVSPGRHFRATRLGANAPEILQVSLPT